MQINAFFVSLLDVKKLKKSLSGARIPINPEIYLHFCIILTLLSAFAMLLVQLLLLVFNIEFSLLPFLPYSISQLLLFIVAVGAGDL